MRWFQRLLPFLFSLALIGPGPYAGAKVSPAEIITVTISGVVTGPRGPAPDVAIDVNASPSGLPYGASALTDSHGYYSLTVQTGGTLNLHARPSLASRLAEVNMRRDGITGDFTHNFTAPAGHLLSLRPADEAGAPLTLPDWQLLAYAMLTPTPPGYLSEYHLMRDDTTGRYECVLPPDVYSVQIRTPPAGYLPVATIFDLRGADRVTDLVFSQTASNPTIADPPDTSKIAVGLPDGLGEALITGAAGAVVPTGHILVTNLSSWHRADAVSNADGSFSARIYAPPGSALYIQHGSLQWRSRLAESSEAYDVYPGTLINLPHTHSAAPGATPFAAAGAVAFYAETATVQPHVSAAWAVTGTLRPVTRLGTDASLSYPSHVRHVLPQETSARHAERVDGSNRVTATVQRSISPWESLESSNDYAAGDTFHTAGVLRIYGPGITAATDVSAISVAANIGLFMLGNQDGVALAPHNPAITTRLTVSGLPIRDPYENGVWLACDFQVTGLARRGNHAVEGAFSRDCQLPDDLPAGVYRPVIDWSFNGVPASTQWLGPNGEIAYRNYRLNQAPLPPIVVTRAAQAPAAVRLPWRLMMEAPTQGTRGAAAREDAGQVGLQSFIVTQGAPFIAAPVDRRTGISITYSLEPDIPIVTSNLSSLYFPPSPPLIPFSLPGGSLHVVVHQPDGAVRDLGTEAFAQSLLRAKTSWGGFPLNTGVNSGSTRVDHAYSLRTASDRFRMTFNQYGHHVITLAGEVSDLWGNRYTGGGVYDVWVAEPLDMEPGVLPGTPFDVRDAFNPTVQLYPGVPARVDWTVTEYPNSDASRAIRHTVSGWANRFGYFAGPGFSFSAPGEYRVDLQAHYVDETGALWMGAMTWGGVVMTPAAQAQLNAHGRRGTNNLQHIPGPWFVFCRDLAPIPGMTPHTFAPYFNGDVIWSRQEGIYECSGEALQTGGSVQDTVGVLEARIRQRFARMRPPSDLPGDIEERFSTGELPLISSTRSGRPPQIFPGEIDQIAYMYFYSERPGVRVREDITEDYTYPASYWRFDTLYDDQLGVGIEGDLPNDYKFQYIGAVYRDLDTDYSEYLGQGTGWILLGADDPLGSRVMPPFAGPGNGGWPTDGGPLMRLKGQDIHLFIQPAGTLPGAILQVGDTFRFAGHIMPTLDSQVAATVTSPSGVVRRVSGRANRIGYFYRPAADFVVDEPGLWTVDAQVWHDGACSGGRTVPPYPAGSVLGSQNGRYWFYVTPKDSPRLDISVPAPGYLPFSGAVTPITIAGTAPTALNAAVVSYVITMPGFILATGQVNVTNGAYAVEFDPVALAHDFPNLDLIGRDARNQPGLADRFQISLLLQGQDAGGNPVYQAGSLTLQGAQVLAVRAVDSPLQPIFLPIILK